MLEELTPKKAVEFAITTEELGEKFYRRMASKFSDDEKLTEMFKKLAADEDVHKKQFGKLLESVAERKSDKLDFERQQVLRAMSISQFFSSKGPFANADKIKSPDDALRFAFEFEKAVLAYYQAMRDALGDDEALNAIIEAEKQHVTTVMKVMMTGAELRSLEDRWA